MVYVVLLHFVYVDGTDVYPSSYSLTYFVVLHYLLLFIVTLSLMIKFTLQLFRMFSMSMPSLVLKEQLVRLSLQRSFLLRSLGLVVE